MATPAGALAEDQNAEISAHALLRSAEPAHPGKPSLPRSQFSALTANEVRLLEYVAAGWTSMQIGRHICRSEKTIRNQLTCIYGKLGAANRAEAVALYLRRG